MASLIRWRRVSGGCLVVLAVGGCTRTVVKSVVAPTTTDIGAATTSPSGPTTSTTYLIADLTPQAAACAYWDLALYVEQHLSTYHEVKYGSLLHAATIAAQGDGRWADLEQDGRTVAKDADNRSLVADAAAHADLVTTCATVPHPAPDIPAPPINGAIDAGAACEAIESAIAANGKRDTAALVNDLAIADRFASRAEEGSSSWASFHRDIGIVDTGGLQSSDPNGDGAFDRVIHSCGDTGSVLPTPYTSPIGPPDQGQPSTSPED